MPFLPTLTVIGACLFYCAYVQSLFTSTLSQAPTSIVCDIESANDPLSITLSRNLTYHVHQYEPQSHFRCELSTIGIGKEWGLPQIWKHCGEKNWKFGYHSWSIRKNRTCKQAVVGCFIGEGRISH